MTQANMRAPGLVGVMTGTPQCLFLDRLAG